MQVRLSPEGAKLVMLEGITPFQGFDVLADTCSQGVALGYRIPAPLGHQAAYLTGIALKRG